MSSKYVATNKGSTTVGANFNETATTFTVGTGEGARLPAPTGGDYTLLVLQNTAGVREIICVVGRTGDVCTVGIPGSAAANVAGRNYEAIYGMAAASWVIGDVVSCRPTAELIEAGVNFGDAIAAATNKATPVDADKFAVSDSAAGGASSYSTWANIKAALLAAFGAATSKATPVDADALPLYDSAAPTTQTKLTWANLKAALFAAWGALTTAGTSKATPVDADSLAICDSAASDATKKLTWANLKATLKTYNDTLYLTAPFPTGTKMLFQQTAAPTGWTKDTTHNDKALRVVSGTASSGGTAAFSTVFGQTATASAAADLAAHSHVVTDPGHAHSVTDPGHAHTIPASTNAGPGAYIYMSASGVDITQNYSGNAATTGVSIGSAGTGVSVNSAGAGGGHAHAMDIRVQYVDLIIATRN